MRSSDVFFKIIFLLCWMLWSKKCYFFIMQITNFRGDLSDISAKMATLIGASLNEIFAMPCTGTGWPKFVVSLVIQRENSMMWFCWSNQTTWVTHKHYLTYETVAVHITEYNCNSAKFQVYLWIAHSCTSTMCSIEIWSEIWREINIHRGVNGVDRVCSRQY